LIAEGRSVKRVGTDEGAPTERRVLSLIIVAREQCDLWRSLADEFRDVGQIQILLDRRQGERRTPRDPVAYDRRTRDRRSRPRLEDDLRARQYVLVRPCDRRPRD
jgi:hypothetical protein